MPQKILHSTPMCKCNYGMRNLFIRKNFYDFSLALVTMDKNSEEPCTKRSMQILKLVSSLLGPPVRMLPDLAWVASTSWMMTVQSALRSTMLLSLVWVTNRNFAKVCQKPDQGALSFLNLRFAIFSFQVLPLPYRRWLT